MATCANCIHHSLCDYNTNISGNGKVRLVYSDGADVKCSFFQNTSDVIPKIEVEKLELTLQGVMWSVDKWLDEKDYDADPIKRAITMREKTLKIVENAKSEVAREIFAEIEQKLLPSNTSGEFRGDSIEWFDYFDLHLAEDIAELKKKYTEEQT